MKHLFASLILATATLCAGMRDLFAAPRLRLANTVTIGQEDVETHCGPRQYKVDNAVSAYDLLFKEGTDGQHIDICGAADLPLGTVDNKTLVAEDFATLLPLGYGATRRMIASEAMAVGDDVYTAAAGKVQDEPAVAGTYYKVGRVLKAALADGDTIEVETHQPIKVVVIAALTAPVTAAGSDAGTTQTLANAIKVDLTAIDTALASPALLKII